MDNISQMEDTCSYVGVYCISSCEKIIDPSWLGYKFDSNFYSIEYRCYKLYDFCNKTKIKKKQTFLSFKELVSVKTQKVFV